jgi:hypothetical protein
MRVEQTSPTTFELQTDNGCIALAGFSTETMGAPGVYWYRIAIITRKDATEAFLADPRVKAAITPGTENDLPPSCNAY